MPCGEHQFNILEANPRGTGKSGTECLLAECVNASPRVYKGIHPAKKKQGKRLVCEYIPEEIWPDRGRILEVQSQRLVHQLRTVAESNPFWQQRFAASGIDVADIRGVEDLSRLPVTTKQELIADQLANPPYGTNLTFPLVDYKRLHQTSGTSGTPLRVPDTSSDWDWFMECWRQKFVLIDLAPDDRVFCAFSFGPFIGFWAAFEAASRQGYMCIPGGGLSTLRRLELIEHTSATVLCCVPTYAMRMAEVAQEHGIDLRQSSIRIIIVAGEPGGSIPSIRKRIEETWGARVIDHWGMTEIGSLATEHLLDPGSLMVLETECIAEIVSRETLQPVAAGEVGELLVTNLGRTGIPLFRYRTGDLVRAATDPSPTDLKLLRLEGGVLGRADQMVTVRGNNVYPSSIESILREFDDVAEFRIEVRTQRSMQHLRVVVEPVADVSDVPAFQARVEQALTDQLGFHLEVLAAKPGELPRFEMKAHRFHRIEDAEDRD